MSLPLQLQLPLPTKNRSMDPQRSLLLNFTYFHQDKSMDDLPQSLLLTMELEDTRLHAQEELKARDQEIAHLKNLLAAAIRDKDEAVDKYHKLMLHKLTPLSSVDDDHRNNAFSSSDCDESIVSSPAAEADLDLPLLVDRPLPEKGKFLQAVMKAGPLLQTLLLAGPLPQWRHPPPPLDTYQIPPPPVVIPSPPTTVSTNQETFDYNNNCAMNRKRRLSEISQSAMNELKYQRVLLQ